MRIFLTSITLSSSFLMSSVFGSNDLLNKDDLSQSIPSKQQSMSQSVLNAPVMSSKSSQTISAGMPELEKPVPQDKDEKHHLLGDVVHKVGSIVHNVIHDVLNHGDKVEPTLSGGTAHAQTHPDAENILTQGLDLFKKVFKSKDKGVESFGTVLALLEEWSERTRQPGEDSNTHMESVLKELQASLGKKMMKEAADQADRLGGLSKSNTNSRNNADSTTMTTSLMVQSNTDRGIVLDKIENIGSEVIHVVESSFDFVSSILDVRLGKLRSNILDGTTSNRVKTVFSTIDTMIQTTTVVSPIISSALVTVPPVAAAFNVFMTGVNIYGKTLNSQEQAINNVIDMLKKRLASTQTTSVSSVVTSTPIAVEPVSVVSASSGVSPQSV